MIAATIVIGRPAFRTAIMNCVQTHTANQHQQQAARQHHQQLLQLQLYPTVEALSDRVKTL